MATTNNYFIKQGDAYNIPVSITVDGETVNGETVELIETVEFMLSEDIRKVYPEDVTFDSVNNVFLVPVSQEETFAMEDGEKIPLDIRVGFSSGDVIGTKTMQQIKILDALSEEEI